MIAKSVSSAQQVLKFPEHVDTDSNPPSNTGLDSQPSAYTGIEVGVDALTLLWSGRNDLLSITKRLLDIEFDFDKSTSRPIGVTWDRCYRGTLGCLYSERDTADGVCYRLALSGSALSRLPCHTTHRYIQICCNIPEVRCSRIDIRADDYGNRLRFDDIFDALSNLQYSGFKTAVSIINHGSCGWTFNLGSRESEQYTRIYNKEAESHGKIKSRRFESEFKGKKAEQIFASIGLEDSCTAQTFVRWLVGKVNFIDVTDKNLDRCFRLDWWESFLDDLNCDACIAIVAKVESSIESKMAWVRRQVSKSIATISKAIGENAFDDWFAEIIEVGKDKMRRYEDILCSEYYVCQNIC
jgi:Replication initiation factor